MLRNGVCMIAQVNVTLLVSVILGVALLICGVYVWVASHIANRKRHPDADKIIYMDYCAKSQELIKARHNAAEKRADERHIELKDLIIANGRAK